ncbi:MAG TPA: hypothetical protein VLA82_06250 [Actinomycetota bacterium]|nr:hypothetical protein [Actinomycetota bacterium]
MQSERFDRGWSAGPRPRLGVVAAVAIAVGAILGGLLGWAIQATILPGAGFAVIASAFVGAGSGVLYTSWLATDADGSDDAA